MVIRGILNRKYYLKNQRAGKASAVDVKTSPLAATPETPQQNTQ